MLHDFDIVRRANACLIACITVLGLVAATSPAVARADPTKVDAPAQTGIDAVDRLSQALVVHDLAAVVALVGYTDVLCITAPAGIPAPPLCSVAGVPPGSLVPVLPIAGCELELLLPQEVPERLMLRIAADQQLYGVFVPARHPFGDVVGPNVPRPDYAVVMLNTQFLVGEPYLPSGSVYFLLSGEVVAISSFGVCGAPLPESNDSAWILRPTAA